jgi:hypothetical protein
MDLESGGRNANLEQGKQRIDCFRLSKRKMDQKSGDKS